LDADANDYNSTILNCALENLNGKITYFLKMNFEIYIFLQNL